MSQTLNETSSGFALHITPEADPRGGFWDCVELQLEVATGSLT